MEAPIHRDDGMPFNGNKCHDASGQFTGWKGAARLLVSICGDLPVRIFVEETCRRRQWHCRDGRKGSRCAGSCGAQPLGQPCAYTPQVATLNRVQCPSGVWPGVARKCMQVAQRRLGSRAAKFGPSPSESNRSAAAPPDSWEILSWVTAKTDETGVLAVSAVGCPVVLEISRAARASQFIHRPACAAAPG